VPDALVYIVPADRKVVPKRGELYWESQSKGFFKFDHIPPGDYLILVNPDDIQSPNFPYPRTFYPGVRYRELATVITVREGEQIEEAHIRLVQQFEPRNVTVRVTWADGRLTRNLVFIQAKPVFNSKAW
jgi:hypothetical protein